MRRGEIVITVGTLDELRLVDWTIIGWEVKATMEWLHDIAYVHLMHYRIFAVTDWSNRTASMLHMNKLDTVGKVVNLPLKDVDRIPGCGVVIRREIYIGFRDQLGMVLDQWSPELHTTKYGRVVNGDGE